MHEETVSTVCNAEGQFILVQPNFKVNGELLTISFPAMDLAWENEEVRSKFLLQEV